MREACPRNMTESMPRIRTVLWRGLHKRCPQCGRGRIFSGWIKLNDRCGVCGLQLLRNQGDLWGYLVALDRALFILPLIVMIYFRLNNPNSVWFIVFCAAVFFGFIFTLPHRNGMSLGLDYWIRRKCGDLASTEAASPSDRLR